MCNHRGDSGPEARGIATKGLATMTPKAWPRSIRAARRADRRSDDFSQRTTGPQEQCGANAPRSVRIRCRASTEIRPQSLSRGATSPRAGRNASGAESRIALDVRIAGAALPERTRHTARRGGATSARGVGRLTQARVSRHGGRARSQGAHAERPHGDVTSLRRAARARAPSEAATRRGVPALRVARRSVAPWPVSSLRAGARCP